MHIIAKANVSFVLALLCSPLPPASAAKAPKVAATREPIGVLVSVGKNAELLLDHAESRMPASNGDLLYPGYRLVTGGSRTDYTSFPGHSAYTLSPKVSTSVGDFDKFQIDRRNDQFDVQFDIPQSILKNVRVADQKAIAYPLFYPFAKSISSGSDINALEKELKARSSDPIIRLSVAALQESRDQLVPALDNYRLLAAEWKDAKWLGSKIPVLQKDIAISKAKAAMADRPPRSFAVVIGVSKYQRLAKLAYADRDAMSMADFLTDPRGGGLDPRNVTVLTNESATNSSIRNAIAGTLELKAGPRDTVYIFLSGRGFAQKIGNTPRGYFMGFNSDPQEKRASAYAVEDLAELLRRQLPRLRRVFLFADIERSGPTAFSAESINEAVARQVDQQSSRIKAILASGPGKASLEKDNLGGGHGIFSYYLVAGLKGEARQADNGEVTASSLFSYVSQRVSDATSGRQKPGIFGTLDDTTPVLGENSVTHIAPRSGFQLLANLAFPAIRPSSFLALLVPEHQAAPDGVEKSAEALEAEGQFVVSQYLRGYEQTQPKEEFSRAADLFGRADVLNPSAYLQARRLFCEGRFRTMNNDAENAVPLLQRAILLDPDGGYSFNALGIAYLRLKRPDDAARAFRDAIGRAPTWVYPRHNLALAYSEAGIYDGAERVYRDAMKIAPDYGSLHYNLGLFYQNLNRREDAKAEYEEALRLNASLAEAYAGLATIQAAAGGKFWKSAETNYLHSLSLKPEALPVKHDLALLYGQRRDNDQAVKLWKEILQSDPSFLPSRIALAHALTSQDRFTEASEQYREVLRQRAELVAAEIALHEVLGDDLVSKGKHAGAAPEYQAALGLAVDEDERRRLKRKFHAAQK